MEDIESLSVTERLVLLSITDLDAAGETPVESLTLKQRTREILGLADLEVVGELSEPDIMRALNVLGAQPYVGESTSETSATGKGRPKYELAVAPDGVLDALSGDDRLADAIAEIPTGDG